MAFEIADDRIVRIWAIRNPEKLRPLDAPLTGRHLRAGGWVAPVRRWLGGARASVAGWRPCVGGWVAPVRRWLGGARAPVAGRDRGGRVSARIRRKMCVWLPRA